MLCKTSPIVLCSFHDILNILLYSHISKASNLSNVTLVSVHVSAPYTSVNHIKHFAMRDLNSMLMFLDVRIFDILSNAVLVMPILLLISLSHFPSSVAMYPRYTILSTCWIGFPSTLILMLGTGYFLLITIDLVLIMFISMPYGWPFSLTAVTKACRNIGPSASKTVSSAYLRLW